MTDAGAKLNDQAVDQDRRKFLTIATSATAAVGAIFAASPFVASWRPSERAKALGAPVSVDLSKLEPGQMVTVRVAQAADLHLQALARRGGGPGRQTTPASRIRSLPNPTSPPTR